VEAVRRDPELPHVVLALRASGSLAHFLDGGHQQCEQHRDDGDDYQEFN
jgi:hypothetical protein